MSTFFGSLSMKKDAASYLNEILLFKIDFALKSCNEEYNNIVQSDLSLLVESEIIISSFCKVIILILSVHFNLL